MARHAFLFLFLCGCCFAVGPHPVQAAIPADQILLTTKGYVSIPDADELQRQFNETQLGQLLADPVMQPFVEDLKEQLKHKLTEAGIRVGITLEDLNGLGNFALRPFNRQVLKHQHAMAVIVDVTGQLAATQRSFKK